MLTSVRELVVRGRVLPQAEHEAAPRARHQGGLEAVHRVLHVKVKQLVCCAFHSGRIQMQKASPLALAHHDLRLHPAAGGGGEVVAVPAVDAEVEVEVRRPSASPSSGDVDPDARAPGPHAVGHVDHRRVEGIVAVVLLLVIVLQGMISRVETAFRLRDT